MEKLEDLIAEVTPQILDRSVPLSIILLRIREAMEAAYLLALAPNDNESIHGGIGE